MYDRKRANEKREKKCNHYVLLYGSTVNNTINNYYKVIITLTKKDSISIRRMKELCEGNRDWQK